MVDPLIFFPLGNMAFALGLGWLPKNSLLRPILMVFIAASCWKANRSPLLRYVPGAVGNDYIIGTILGLSYQLCLAKCTPPPGKRGLRKFLWGLNRSISPRWDTVHIPPFSEKDKSYVPSRGKLILSRLWEFAWLSALIQFSVKSQPISIPQYIYSGEQSWNPFQLLARREEFLLRLHLGFLCIFIPAAALWAAHSLLTCIWLLCGDSPTSWPPLFGPIRTAYTMRRFYAFFWHHAMRRAFTSHAIFVVTKILRLPQRHPISRYLITYLAFMISALMHTCVNPGWERHMLIPQLTLYHYIVAAVILEDVIISKYRAVGGRYKVTTGEGKKDSEKEDVRGIEKRKIDVKDAHETDNAILKGLGYGWVAGFWMWSGSNLMFSLYGA